MTLLNTLLFSLGIAALAAPLWVHLRLGRVKKRAVVSSLLLMLAAQQSSRSPRKIVNWPLFLLRCLLILMISLGFGRLLIPSFGSGNAKAYAAFIVDVSGSMQATYAGQPLWEQSHQSLQKTLNNLDPASKVAIIPSPVGSYQPTWESPADALTRASKLQPGHAANRLANEIRDATRLLSDMPDDNPKFLHILSDFQRTALAGIDQITLPTNIELQIEKFGPQQAQNRGLTVSVLAAGATEISLYAFTDGTNGEIQLIENGEENTFLIAPGQVASRLTNTDSNNPWTERELILDEDDALAADNFAYDVFQPQQPIPVWLFEPRGTVDNNAQAFDNTNPAAITSVRHIYEQASYFINTALQPVFNNESQSESRFQPQTLYSSNLPSALNSLNQANSPRILFIPATATIPNDLTTLAENIVTNGGAVIFFSGPELIPDSYNLSFASILPVKIGASEELSLTPAMASIDDRHPLWGGLDTQTRHQLTSVSMHQRHTVEPIANARTLAYYADATPLIIEHTNGSGRVYFVNSSADRQWSDWPADPPLFVPAIHLLAARALGFEAFAPTHQPLLAGERTTLTLNPTHAGQTILCNNQQYTADDAGLIHDIRFDSPGIHNLTLEDDTPIHRVAVNFPPTESILESYPESVALQRLESLRQPGTESTLRWETDADNGGLAWKLCMAFAAMLLLIEPVLANARSKS